MSQLADLVTTGHVDGGLVVALVLLGVGAGLAATVLLGRLREARAARAAERDLLISMVDHTDAIVIVLDPDGTVRRINRAGEETSGYPAAAVVGRPIWDAPFVPDDERAPARRDLAHLVRAGAPMRHGSRWITPDGAVRHLRWSIKPLPGPAGAIAFILGIGLDVTAQHAAEEAIAASERRHRRVLEVSHDVLFELDTDRRFTYLAPQWEALSGLPVGETLGARVEELPSIVDLDRVQARVADLLRGAIDLVEAEIRWRPAGGEQRWVAVRAHAVHDEAGRITGLAGALRDVTEDVAVRRRLEREQAFAEALFEQFPAGLTVCDADGRLRMFDPHTRGFQEATLADEPPEHWAERFGLRGADDRPLRPDETPLFRALYAGEVVRDAELRVTRTNGAGPLTLMMSAGPIVGPGGERLGAVATYTDVTRLREAEAEARATAGDLAALGRIAHQLASATDGTEVRRTICTAAAEGMDGEALAALWEPEQDGLSLRCTATAGWAAPHDIVLPIGGAPSGAIAAYVSGRPLFVADCHDHPMVHPDMVANLQVCSGFWAPVLRDETPIGALSVMWRSPMRELSPRRRRMLDLLASEAAVAIERATLVARLADSARTDPLTGVPNRRAWGERLPQELARAKRQGDPVAVAIIDLDHFKRFNDANGHVEGDRLLCQATAAWTRVIRASDLLARFGGEEFAIVLPGCTSEEAAPLVERLRGVLPGEETCSAGIAHWDGRETAAELVGRADTALYRAKQSGRDRVCLAR